MGFYSEKRLLLAGRGGGVESVRAWLYGNVPNSGDRRSGCHWRRRVVVFLCFLLACFIFYFFFPFHVLVFVLFS